MPVIRGIYYKHPKTGEPGIWIWCAWGDQPIIGISQTQLDSIKLVGSPANRQIVFKSTVEGGLLAGCEHRKALVGWTTEELEQKAANPAPYTTIDVATSEMVIQPLVISITPISLDTPRRLQIEISDGAYTSDTRYG